jgi:hypothetical protein
MQGNNTKIEDTLSEYGMEGMFSVFLYALVTLL